MLANFACSRNLCILAEGIRSLIWGEHLARSVSNDPIQRRRSWERTDFPLVLNLLEVYWHGRQPGREFKIYFHRSVVESLCVDDTESNERSGIIEDLCKGAGVLGVRKKPARLFGSECLKKIGH